jgi:hypothetical protein
MRHSPPRRTTPGARVIAVVLLVAAARAGAQSSSIDGPPRPVAPDVITRGESGQATVRAIKLTAPLTLDGKLDEAVYSREKPFGGLIQVTPNFMELMSERSDVWIMYDDANMYVTCKCYDSAPPSEWIANELRRDTNGPPAERPLRRDVRHVLRPPQRLRILYESVGRSG